jgi:hypothetical protein
MWHFDIAGFRSPVIVAIMTTDFSHSDTRPSSTIGEYAFCAPDSVESTDRDFELSISDDRTCKWEDMQGRMAARVDQQIVVKEMIGDPTAKKEMEREKEAFTFESKIGEDAYKLIVEKEAMTARGIEITEGMCTILDRALAPYFWNDVNPHLATPLTRIRCSV